MVAISVILLWAMILGGDNMFKAIGTIIGVVVAGYEGAIIGGSIGRIIDEAVDLEQWI